MKCIVPRFEGFALAFSLCCHGRNALHNGAGRQSWGMREMHGLEHAPDCRAYYHSILRSVQCGNQSCTAAVLEERDGINKLDCLA